MLNIIILKFIIIKFKKATMKKMTNFKIAITSKMKKILKTNKMTSSIQIKIFLLIIFNKIIAHKSRKQL